MLKKFIIMVSCTTLILCTNTKKLNHAIDKKQLVIALKEWIYRENVLEMFLEDPQALGQGNAELARDLQELRGYLTGNWIGWQQARVTAFCQKWGLEKIVIDEVCKQ